MLEETQLDNKPQHRSVEETISKGIQQRNELVKENLLNQFGRTNDIEKAKSGEGSKGGHVVGHTKSGKPVYSIVTHEKHRKFSSKDYQEAATLHAGAEHNQKYEDSHFDEGNKKEKQEKRTSPLTETFKKVTGTKSFGKDSPEYKKMEIIGDNDKDWETWVQGVSKHGITIKYDNENDSYVVTNNTGK